MKRSFNLSLGQCKLKPQTDTITYTLGLLKCKILKQVWRVCGETGTLVYC